MFVVSSGDMPMPQKLKGLSDVHSHGGVESKWHTDFNSVE